MLTQSRRTAKRRDTYPLKGGTVELFHQPWHLPWHRKARSVNAQEELFIALDLETDTNPGDGLNPLNPLTRITSAALWIGTKDGIKVLYRHAFQGDERSILESLDRTLDVLSFAGFKGELVTWNGSSFDLKFLVSRYAYWEISTGLRYRSSCERLSKYPSKAIDSHNNQGYLGTWYGFGHVDAMLHYKGLVKMWGISYGLKPVATLFGLNPIEVDRTAMHLLTEQELTDYALSDVRCTYWLAVHAGQAMVRWYDEVAPSDSDWLDPVAHLEQWGEPSAWWPLGARF